MSLARGQVNMTGTVHALWKRGLHTPARWRYAVGILAAVASSLVRIGLGPWWGPSFPYMFYFPTTLLTALFGGLGAAWVGIAVGAVMTARWVLPTTAFASSHHRHVVGLVVYLLTDGLVAWIGAAHRDLTDQSERQSAELTAREQVLATTVAALEVEKGIARAAQAEAERANRAKDDFVAVLSHELRTPLTTIVSAVRLLPEGGNSEERTSRVRETIERQALHLSRMVDDLLDMKKVVAGTIEIRRQPCDLAQAVGACVATFNEAGRFEDHTVTVEAEPVWVDGDVVRLQQIFGNLIGNALKFTPAGGVIRLSVTREGHEAVVRVHDTGIGIASNLLPRVFELFVQGDQGSRRGLGIGLAVVRLLVELHGGTVQASSDGSGKGSTFTVRLPRLYAV